MFCSSYPLNYCFKTPKLIPVKDSLYLCIGTFVHLASHSLNEVKRQAQKLERQLICVVHKNKKTVIHYKLVSKVNICNV